MRFSKVAMVLVTGVMMFNFLGCNWQAILAGQAEDAIQGAAAEFLTAVETQVTDAAPDLLDPVVADWFDTVGEAVDTFIANQVPGND